jgi:tetratricopeptide (TPR) repeat protein
MALFERHRSIASLASLILIALSMASTLAFSQNPPPNQSPGSSKPTRKDSVEVVGHLSPEEAEEGRLNDIYESVAQVRRKSPCTPEIIHRYESEVIPAANKSTFNVPKSKFLFLANTDIGNCYLGQQKFAEAEASLQASLQYAPVWPGTDDSAFPINFRQLGTAQMGQQHWPAAEQSLLKSIGLFDPQITAGEKRDAELHAQFSLNYRGSQSESYALLAIVYLREGRIQEALNTVEKAYNQVTKYNLAPRYLKEVTDIGKAIANAGGDSAAQKVWSQRGPGN